MQSAALCIGMYVTADSVLCNAGRSPSVMKAGPKVGSARALGIWGAQACVSPVS